MNIAKHTGKLKQSRAHTYLAATILTSKLSCIYVEYLTLGLYLAKLRVKLET